MKKFFLTSLLVVLLACCSGNDGSSKNNLPADNSTKTDEEISQESTDTDSNETEPNDDEKIGTDDNTGTETEKECTGISSEIGDFYFVPINYLYQAPVDFGNETNNQMVVLFYGDDYDTSEGQLSYKLDEEKNRNLKTCSECVSLNTDIVMDDEGGITLRRFFQRSGTITVKETAMVEGHGQNGEAIMVFGPKSIVEIKDLVLEEVTVDTSDFNSTVVKGGDCYRIDGVISWDTTKDEED